MGRRHVALDAMAQRFMACKIALSQARGGTWVQVSGWELPLGVAISPPDPRRAWFGIGAEMSIGKMSI